MLVKSLESHFVYRGFTPEKLNTVKYYFGLKLVDWRQDRYTIFEVIEDSPKPDSFLMKARNNFESFSNCNP